VQVAVGGVPCRAGLEAMLGKQCLQVAYSFGDPGWRDADVFDHQGGAWRTKLAVDAQCGFADVPVQFD